VLDRKVTPSATAPSPLFKGFKKILLRLLRRAGFGRDPQFYASFCTRLLGASAAEFLGDDLLESESDGSVILNFSKSLSTGELKELESSLFEKALLKFGVLFRGVKKVTLTSVTRPGLRQSKTFDVKDRTVQLRLAAVASFLSRIEAASHSLSWGRSQKINYHSSIVQIVTLNRSLLKSKLFS
jgi:hypothetical protein